MKSIVKKRNNHQPSTRRSGRKASLLAVAIVAVGLSSSAVSQAAAVQTHCAPAGNGTVCQSHGNAQLALPAPTIHYHPYGHLQGPPAGDRDR